MKVSLAEHSHDIDAVSGSFENDPIVTSSQSIYIDLVSLQLFDPFPVWDRIVCEAGTIGENLTGDLVWQ